MKAVVYTRYGGPDVLGYAEIPKPVPADDEVLVKVKAVSLNDWDWGLLQGSTFLDRMMAGRKAPRIQVLGSDVAGTVEVVGRNVSKFRPGDEVFGDLSGRWSCFAEYVTAKEVQLAIKPVSMTFEQAASIPQAGMLAVQGLIDRGGIRSGQQILLNGAGGGVGTFAIQIARQYGVGITAVDRGSKLDMLTSLGANRVIDYTKEDFTSGGMQYDLILDVRTNRSAFDYLKALRPNGVYATVGGSLGRLFQVFSLGPIIRISTGKKLRVVALKANKDLGYIAALFEAGKMKPVIDPHRFTLAQVPEAFKLFATGNHLGKIVISV